MLKDINNTLTVTLLPISFLDTDARRIVQKLDEITIKDVSATLEAANSTDCSISELLKMQLRFVPNLRVQIEKFREKFDQCKQNFQQNIIKA